MGELRVPQARGRTNDPFEQARWVPVFAFAGMSGPKPIKS